MYHVRVLLRILESRGFPTPHHNPYEEIPYIKEFWSEEVSGREGDRIACIYALTLFFLDRVELTPQEREAILYIRDMAEARPEAMHYRDMQLGAALFMLKTFMIPNH
ncbi:MAG: hypothetical protein OEY01_03415 [Desulfobulbaceae bacterium]|nr:hypothetical protein [Desulfobulbaceae bacterium]